MIIQREPKRHGGMGNQTYLRKKTEIYYIKILWIFPAML